MRPLSQKRSKQGPSIQSRTHFGGCTWIIFLLAQGVAISGCASGGSGGSTTPPPPQITVTIAPTSGTLLLGNTLPFSATVTIASHFALQLAAPSSLQPGVAAAIVATLTPVPGSNPNAVLSWSLSGSGCSGSACGILSVITTQSAGVGAIADTANYTAPATPPQPNTIVITVTPQADPSKQTQATITIQTGPSLNLLPNTATLAANHRVTLTVAENGTTGSSLVWSVNGISGGNSTVGQLCVVASSPCQSITTGTAAQADYIAPGAIPFSNPVSVQVAIAGNPAIFSSTQITVINHILVNVFPNGVTLPPLGVQGFTASVLGTGNQAVVWQVQGSACAVSGACGSITPSGTFTGPAAAPTPNAIQVAALSQDDSTQSGTASVTISSGSSILSLHPASVYAGGANGFTLTVDGSGFVLSNPGPGSTLLIGGTARVTTCTSANSCSAPVNSTDVAQPGNVSVQIQSPSGTLSNIVNLVVAVPGTTDDVISLTSSTPAISGKNITVVEPTTAGVDNSSVSFDLNVAALGVFNTSANACNLGGNPIPLTRPVSGTTAADICLFSQSGFDTSMAYIISGPGDVAVISKQPAGLGIIHLTVQIPSTALPGARTLFVQNANLDKTAASGVLEIQ